MKREIASAPPQPINLQERIATLTAKRQEILRPVLEHPRGFVLLSVRAMAKRLGTDPATIVRIVRVLGFASFREFQKYLHDLSIAFATSADTMQSAPSERGRHAYVADSIERDLKNLHGLKKSGRRTSRNLPCARTLHAALRAGRFGHIAKYLG
jgi:DNA-binding MurR/RpiR family transcriptional regulator